MIPLGAAKSIGRGSGALELWGLGRTLEPKGPSATHRDKWEKRTKERDKDRASRQFPSFNIRPTSSRHGWLQAPSTGWDKRMNSASSPYLAERAALPLVKFRAEPSSGRLHHLFQKPSTLHFLFVRFDAKRNFIHVSSVE